MPPLGFEPTISAGEFSLGKEFGGEIEGQSRGNFYFTVNDRMTVERQVMTTERTSG
jgi:hypothetical protein